MGKRLYKQLLTSLLAVPFLTTVPLAVSANSTPTNSPAWTKDLIIYELRMKTFTPQGTFNAAKAKLVDLKDLGITAIWLNPISSYTSDYDVTYSVKEPDQVSSAFGTVSDFEAFVTEAHAQGIKVILDIVPHGVTFDSSLVANHPDWFKKDAQGNIIGTWDMADFDWTNQGFIDWWVNMCKTWVKVHGVDGFRGDLEPEISGYSVFDRIRTELNNEGYPIVMISEFKNTRNHVYDFAQVDVGSTHVTQGSKDFLYENDIVDVVKNGISLTNGGAEKWYTYALSTHDSYAYGARLSRLRMGYELLFSPFIPIFMAGEEFNNPIDLSPSNYVLYFNTIDWSQKTGANLIFYNDVKKMIAVRKANPTLFTTFPDDHRQSNIVKVNNSGSYQTTPAYARYNNSGTAAVIVGNNGESGNWTSNSGSWTVEHGELSQREDTQFGHNNVITGRTWNNMTIDLDIRNAGDPDQSDQNWAGVQFRKTNAADGYDQSGYSVLWRSSGSLILYKGSAGGGTVLVEATPNPGVSPRQFRHLKIVASDSNIKVYVEGNATPVMDYNDSTFSNGYVGLVTGGMHAHFDNISITGATNFSDDFTGANKNVVLNIPLQDMNMDRYPTYKVTDLMTDEVTTDVAESSLHNYTVSVAGNDMRALKIEGLGTRATNLAAGAVATTSTSIQSYGFFTNQLNDGNTDSGWSSVGYSDANHTEWAEVNWGPTNKYFNTVYLTPRKDLAGGGFPVDFVIEVWNGTTWLPLVTQTNWTSPGYNQQVFTFGTQWATKIRVRATKLSYMGANDPVYRFQLNEIAVAYK
ncbi:alpha-amylase family glycosyl hydrolase [Paenibacillus sp. SYP-B4298]|uniref:alpha-amylase family glycosyl hydrolase n=1 Tax=Paenibacillus sp. SYP-B4298 TaxID=2996034 RepID=UPI0022DE6EFD|nr:alpha-amylase family glycosyl hydrolase [Paenibacillus sp. SYP-B4298]